MSALRPLATEKADMANENLSPLRANSGHRVGYELNGAARQNHREFGELA
jgi:hypothetical protein